MNLFGINISFSNNNRYVKRRECHEAQDRLKEFVNQRLDDLKDFINIRIDDLKDFLLKNGR